MDKRYEGIVILGAPRSGTTLLRRLLNTHPDIVCPAETNLISAASRFLFESKFSGGLSVGAVPGLGFSGFPEREVLDRLRNFVFSFWRDIRQKSGKQIWAEKTAIDVFHLETVERLLSDNCRYICITRHALDVVCSMKDLSTKMDAFLPELHEYIKKYSLISLAHGNAWLDANYHLLNFMQAHPEWVVSLRYEDLVKSPESEMNRVFKALDLPAIEIDSLAQLMNKSDKMGLGDWKTYEHKTISSRNVGRYKSLDRWTINMLAPIVNPMLEKLGYDLVKVMEQKVKSDSSRAEELGRMVASMKMGIKKDTDDA